MFFFLKWDMIFQKRTFFPSTVNEWNKTDKDIQISESLKIF